jgi:propionyl-CoA carboxylase alpha chain
MMRKLLIANRAEIARRVIRTARAMGIPTVAVYSDVDGREPFVREADEAVRIGGASPAESYLRVEAIVNAARRIGADAIHPGYGFLAENAEFARACAEAGVTFVGPTPAAIAAMGSKLVARRLLAEAGVPVLPGVADAERAAAEVGFPLLVKPSVGGGGKGMRIVRSEAQLEAAVAASRREAASAFGDDTLLFERYVESGRHVEIQILGDSHGEVIHLGERECSIQRRHQKILEESPSVAVDEALRERMAAAAVAAGKAIGYVGAGTVEFLLDASGGLTGGGAPRRFFFLEVNTRLQVEHPVTEEITGIDLVRCQLEIADGGHVPAPPPRRGHAIEVRLYAEDPAADFLPQTGRLSRLAIPQRSGIRVDAGVESGSEISIHYDPMIAKVIAHGPNRAEASRRLAATLRGAEVDGLVTNRDFLVRLLEDQAFLAGDFDTGLLERPEAAALRVPLVTGDDLRASAAAATLAGQVERRTAAVVQPTIPSGWRNNPSQDQRVEYGHGEVTVAVGYRFDRSGELDRLVVDGEALAAPRLVPSLPGEVELELGGVRRTYRVRRDGAYVHVNSAAGQCDLRELARYPDPATDVAPGSLQAPMPGKVVRIDAAVGATVEAGQPLLVLEAMKMEHEIVAPVAGLITVLPVTVGDHVEAGGLLAAIETDATEALR